MPVAPEALELFSVLGVPVHLSKDYLGWLIQSVQQQQGCHVVTLNAEMTMQAERNSALAEIIGKADLIIPDGAGIVMYLRSQGRRVQRCPGIELAEALLREMGSTETMGSAFFIGGKPGIPEQAAMLMQQRMPGLAIAGVQHGYFSAEDEPKLLQTLQTLQPRVILVGLGVPRQEFWIAEHRHLCPHSIWIGIGGSFDIWAGAKTRAPKWLRNNNLEWVYRLYKEPWRWRRMLDLPRFVWRALIYRLLHREIA
jgi:N-acetylglucosaminyldiphosphoundecaprenol N-acetyl-beta-D-mannosaminyltransferase